MKTKKAGYLLVLLLAIQLISLSSAVTSLNSCQNLTIAGETYVLNTSIVNQVGACFGVTANNIVFDGNGSTIDGDALNTPSAIYSYSGSNLTIQNVQITDYYVGIYFQSQTNSQVLNSSTYNTAWGIEMLTSSNNNFSDISTSSSTYGIEIFTSNNNNFMNVVSRDNALYGIDLDGTSTGNQFLNITSNNNTEGITLYYTSNNNFNYVTTNNNSDGGINYFQPGGNNTFTNITANSNKYGVYLFNSFNTTIANGSFSNNTYGIILDGETRDNIYDIYSYANFRGIFLQGSNHNNFLNTLTYNNSNGVSLTASSTNNTFSNASSNSNTNIGFLIQTSTNNYFSNFTADSNKGQSISLSSTSPSNSFNYGLINNSGKTAIVLATASKFNNFTNITILNTNVSFFYFQISSASLNGTYLIDMPYIGNYSLGLIGGTVFFKNGYGEVDYLQTINGTGTNLSSDLKILSNSVFVNSSQAKGLNKSANITLFGVPTNFSYPRIFRDNSYCIDCTNFTSLNSGTVLFNVSSWSTYYIRENDTTAPVITIISPLNSTYPNAISFNVSLDANGTVQYSLDGGITNNSMSSLDNINFNASNLSIADGSYTVNFYAIDLANNLNNNSVTFSTDSRLVINCGNLGIAGATYTLLNDISNVVGSCFIITADNITLNGLGHMIDGDDSGIDQGINVTGRNNVTVLNISIMDFDSGMVLTTTNNSNFRSMNSSSNTNFGITISQTNFNVLSDIRVDFSTTLGLNIGASKFCNYTNITANNNTLRNIMVTGGNRNLLTNVIITGGSSPGALLLSLATNNTFQNVLLNTTGSDSIRFNTAQEIGNTLINVTSLNSRGKDLVFFSAGSNGNILTDCYFNNYSFTGVGVNLTINNSRFGWVSFFQPINKSGSNFSSDIVVGNNSVSVNSAGNSGLNKSANITLSGLPQFIDPVILKDTIICSDCYNFTSLNAGTVTFNVSSFSTYKIAERPSITSQPSPGNTGRGHDGGRVLNQTCLNLRDFILTKRDKNGNLNLSTIDLQSILNNVPQASTQSSLLDIINYCNTILPKEKKSYWWIFYAILGLFISVSCMILIYGAYLFHDDKNKYNQLKKKFKSLSTWL